MTSRLLFINMQHLFTQQKIYLMKYKLFSPSSGAPRCHLHGYCLFHYPDIKIYYLSFLSKILIDQEVEFQTMRNPQGLSYKMVIVEDSPKKKIWQKVRQIVP